MGKTRVFICDLDHKDVREETEVFKEAGIEFEWLHCKTQDEVIEKCAGAEVFLNQYVRMDEKIFKAIPTLKCVVRYGVGYDNIAIEDATKYGVLACNIPDYGTHEVADQALALMMALVRKITLANTLIRRGTWDYQKQIPVKRLSESTVGVCGVGRIGSEFARRAAALGCKVIAYDVEYKKPGRVFPDFVEFVSFDELLTRSDILSIHCLLNQSTYHMFGKRELALMKPSSYIINVSRGGIIDEGALLDALNEKRIAGAGIDVVEKEPLSPDNPLLAHDNFLITPHAAWYSEESAAELKRKCAQEAVLFLSGQKPRYPINLI